MRFSKTTPALRSKATAAGNSDTKSGRKRRRRRRRRRRRSRTDNT